jgi:tRNA A37 threonylcarbamoyladenosine synthetase subunit TsaC/SUA5/YrdC
VIPTDTVYGLAATRRRARAARALYAAKGRDARRPTAILFASVDELLARVPELPAERVAPAGAAARAVTLVVPNPDAAIRGSTRSDPTRSAYACRP